MTEVAVCGKLLVSSLIDHGILPNKSDLNLPFPEVADEWLPHFVRGFFDGDGYCSVKKNGSVNWCLLGSNRFIEGCRDRIVEVTGVKCPNMTPREAPSDLWKVCWSDKESLLVLRDWIYPPGQYPYLIRKQGKLTRV